MPVKNDNKSNLMINYDQVYYHKDSIEALPLTAITAADIRYPEISFSEFFESEMKLRSIPRIERIIINKKKKATTVIWTDGDVTVVKRSKGDRDEPYFAVASALAIKCYGSNSKFKSIIDDKISYIGAKK